MNRIGTNPSLCVVAYLRAGHRYVWVFDDDSLSAALRTVTEYAMSPEMEFDWFDAIIVSQRMRSLTK